MSSYMTREDTVSEYECLRLNCWKCLHVWIENRKVNAMREEHSMQVHEEVDTTSVSCPECGNDEYDVEYTRWKVV